MPANAARKHEYTGHRNVFKALPARGSCCSSYLLALKLGCRKPDKLIRHIKVRAA